MSTSGLARPPRAARPRVHLPPTPPPRFQPPRPRNSFERVLAWSILVSVVAHLLVLLLSPLFVRVDVPPGATASAPVQPSEAFGLEAIVAIPSENAPEQPVARDEPVQRPPTPPRSLPRAQTPTPSAVPTPSAAPGDQPRRSANDALRPGYRDARLYVVPNQFPELEKTEHEVYMEHLQARIDALNDSMMVASNRERRTSDWTYTDKDGDKWGLSPDGLHLGGVTIPRAVLPLPGATGDNTQIMEERERQRQRDEIQRQEEDRERTETQNERIEETRRARDQARQDDGS